jgi:hypothetical protein
MHAGITAITGLAVKSVPDKLVTSGQRETILFPGAIPASQTPTVRLPSGRVNANHGIM